METLKYFNWKKFSIIYMDEFRTMAETLEQLALQNNMTVNHNVRATNDMFASVIGETKNETRSKCFKIINNSTIRKTIKINKIIRNLTANHVR